MTSSSHNCGVLWKKCTKGTVINPYGLCWGENDVLAFSLEDRLVVMDTDFTSHYEDAFKFENYWKDTRKLLDSTTVNALAFSSQFNAPYFSSLFATSIANGDVMLSFLRTKTAQDEIGSDSLFDDPIILERETTASVANTCLAWSEPLFIADLGPIIFLAVGSTSAGSLEIWCISLRSKRPRPQLLALLRNTVGITAASFVSPSISEENEKCVVGASLLYGDSNGNLFSIFLHLQTQAADDSEARALTVRADLPSTLTTLPSGVLRLASAVINHCLFVAVLTAAGCPLYRVDLPSPSQPATATLLLRSDPLYSPFIGFDLSPSGVFMTADSSGRLCRCCYPFDAPLDCFTLPQKTAVVALSPSGLCVAALSLTYSTGTATVTALTFTKDFNDISPIVQNELYKHPHICRKDWVLPFGFRKLSFSPAAPSLPALVHTERLLTQAVVCVNSLTAWLAAQPLTASTPVVTTNVAAALCAFITALHARAHAASWEYPREEQRALVAALAALRSWALRLRVLGHSLFTLQRVWSHCCTASTTPAASLQAFAQGPAVRVSLAHMADLATVKMPAPPAAERRKRGRGGESVGAEAKAAEEEKEFVAGSMLVRACEGLGLDIDQSRRQWVGLLQRLCAGETVASVKAAFRPSPDSSFECCPVCDEAFAFNLDQPLTAVCRNGHCFKRCFLSLLPHTSSAPCTTCEVCDCISFSPSALNRLASQDAPSLTMEMQQPFFWAVPSPFGQASICPSCHSPLSTV